MSYLLFEIKDNKDELHRVVVRDIGTILTINDEFMTKQIMVRKGIEKIKYCSIKPNVENLTLSIRDYTLTDTIYMSSLFDFCAGYGYKPFRIIRTSGIMVLINTFMFSFMKFVEILSKMWSIPLNGESFCKGAIIVWNYFLISIAALAGQNSFELRDGLPYWLSVIEYLLGVVLFAMFVNALYARYKE